MSTAHRLSVAALAAALAALHPSKARAQEQEHPKPAASQPATPAPAVAPTSADERRTFSGDYDLSLPDGRILGVRVYAEGEQLMIVPEDQEKAPMRYFGHNTFGLDFDPTLRLTFDVKDGKVTGGRLVQQGTTINVFRRP